MATQKVGGEGKTSPAKTEPKKTDAQSKKPGDKKATKEAPKETRQAAKTVFGDVPTKPGNDAKNNDAKQPGNAPKEAGNDAKQPADAPKDQVQPEKTQDNQSKVPLVNDGQPKTANIVTDTEPKVPGDGGNPPVAEPKTEPGAKASVDPKVADPKTPINPKAPIAPKMSNIVYDDNNAPVNATPLVDPKSPNAKLPPPKAPVDPKATDTPEPTVVAPEVDAALNTKTANGKTVAEETSVKTTDDLRKYAEIHKLAELPDDEITRYYKYKKAEAMIKDGIPTGPDPKDPRLPAMSVYGNEPTTDDVFDKEKIDAGVKAGENDPVVQKWLAGKQVYNEERILDEKIRNGEIADVPKDPNTGLRTDYLKNQQKEFINSPEFAKSIAKMPPDKQPEAIRNSVTPFMQLGSTPKETKEQLVNVINNVADVTGQPKPVVDENFDFVKTENGEPVVTDPSGYNVAVGKDGKAVTDKNNGMPYVYGNGGNAQMDVKGNYVQLDPSGNAVVVDGKTGDKNVFDKNTADAMKNPDTGNDVIVDPDTGAAVEKDAKTGEIVKDPQAGLPKVNDTQTGKALTNPANGNAIVADKETGAAVEVDKATGKVVADKEGNPVIVDPKTGYQVWDKNGNKVVADKDSKLAVVTDPKTGIKTIMNPKTGAPMIDPKEGVTAILDPDTKMPIAAVTDKQTGDLIKNSNGQIARIDDDTGLPVVVDPKIGTRTIVDPTNGYAVQDPKGNTLVVDKDTGFAVAKGPDGKDVVEANTGAKLIYDPKTGQPIGKPEFGAYTVVDPKTKLAVEVDPFGRYTVEQSTGNIAVMNAATGQNMTTSDGKLVTIDAKSSLLIANVDSKNMVVNPYAGEYVTEKNSGAKVTVDPNTNLPAYVDPKTGDIYKDPNTGGTPVVNAVTGEPMQDANGNYIQVNPETGQPAPYDQEAGKFLPTAPGAVPLTDEYGGQVTTADGNLVAKDGVTGNTVLIDPATRQPLTEPKSGLPQIVDAKGNVMKDANGNTLVIDKASGKPIAVDADGKAVVEKKSGNTQIFDPATGKAVADIDGNPVVLDKESDAPIFVDRKTGEAMKDPKSGMTLFADPTTGKAIVDPVTGNKAVLDPELNAPVQVDADGKVVADENGQPYIIRAKTGTFVKAPNGSYVVADKTTGLPVVKDPKTGAVTVVNPATGEAVTDPKTGATLQINKNTGIPELVRTNADGVQEVIDPKTGKQKVDEYGNPVFIDKETGQVVLNDPAKGLTDYYTGKAPIIGAPPKKLSELDRQAFSAIKNFNKVIYSGTFDFNAFKLSRGLKGLTEFKNSKMFGAAWGAASISMTIAAWAPGTDRAKKLAEGDPAAWTKFSKDVLGIIKDDTHFVGAPEWLNNFLRNNPANPLNKVQVAPNGDIVKIGANGQYQKFMPAGKDAGGNPVAASWETQPGNYNPNAATQAPLEAPPGTVRLNPETGAWERFNANTAKWEKGGPFSVGPGAKTQEYYAAGAKTPAVSNKAVSLFKTLGTAAKWLSAGATVAIGGISIYTGIKGIADGVNRDNPMKIAAGAFHILSGAGYIGSAAAIAFGATGALGPGLMLFGYAAGFIATIIDIYSDPDGNKPEKEIWTKKVMDEFEGVDVFQPDAKEKLERWYNDWAVSYWAHKAADAARGNIPDKKPGKFGPKWGGTR